MVIGNEQITVWFGHLTGGKEQTLESALTYLHSQDFFEVIVIFHVCGLCFPGMAIVTQGHLCVVMVRNNTSGDKENKEGIITGIIKTSSACSKRPTA